MRARIHWKTKVEGGRNRPPSGHGLTPYTTEIRFKEPAWPPTEAWSLVVEKIPELSSEYDWVANVQFLAKQAPENELRSNREFELYEGKKCVATGVTVGRKQAAADPQKVA
ncbi:MAG TPA: hypothetical protein VHY37_04120 [Tepidisphaeraceae bacterium]|nr:hypothetical protein [Tepidisphaeraceae bacterium]